MALAAPWTEDPFGPPSYPLAVRSPYLSCWLAQGNGTALNAAWPTFWGGSVRYSTKVEETILMLFRSWDGLGTLESTAQCTLSSAHHQ